MPASDLYLFHGRVTPDEQLEDWGPNGPRLKNVVGIHSTYGGVNVFFTDKKSADDAQTLTGWDKFDDHALEMKFHEDMVLAKFVDGSVGYFADWGIIEESDEARQHTDKPANSISSARDAFESSPSLTTASDYLYATLNSFADGEISNTEFRLSLSSLECLMREHGNDAHPKP